VSFVQTAAAERCPSVCARPAAARRGGGDRRRAALDVCFRL